MTCKKRLSDNIGVALSDSFALMSKVSYYYWNIKGSQYYSMKQMFKKHREEMLSMVDTVATAVFLNGYRFCKAGFQEMADTTNMEDGNATNDIEYIIKDLLFSYNIVIIALEKVQLLAIQQGAYSVSHVLSECITTCKIHIHDINSSQ